jgi:hypothetical protein
LSLCLASDPSHIKPKREGGDSGDHVKAIQDVLNTLRQRFPDLNLLPITDDPGTYGDSTAAAVFKYKDLNNIKRPGQPLDDIVGRMTITQLDNDLLHAPKPAPPPSVEIEAPIEIASSTPRENPAKDDLTFDFRPVTRADGNLRIFEFRSKPNGELEEMMLDDLRKGDPKFGEQLARDFFKNATKPSANFASTHGAGSPFSDMVSRPAVWRAEALAFRTQLDAHIKRLGVNGAFSPLQLVNLVQAPYRVGARVEFQRQFLWASESKVMGRIRRSRFGFCSTSGVRDTCLTG